MNYIVKSEYCRETKKHEFATEKEAIEFAERQAKKAKREYRIYEFVRNDSERLIYKNIYATGKRGLITCDCIFYK